MRERGLDGDRRGPGGERVRPGGRGAGGDPGVGELGLAGRRGPWGKRAGPGETRRCSPGVGAGGDPGRAEWEGPVWRRGRGASWTQSAGDREDRGGARKL